MTLSKFGSVSLSALTLCLQIGCGGGDNSGTVNTPAGNMTSGTQISSSSSKANTADYTAVVGLYNANFTSNNINDENFLYIDSTGKITAYNYLGDSKDLGNNCYREATGSEVNATITGKTLNYSAADNQFSVMSGSTSIYWMLDTNKKLSKINYGGSISSPKISIKSGDTTLVIDSKTITTPAISDITAALCK